MNTLSGDEVERRTVNLRNLLVEWDPFGVAEFAPGAYDELVAQLCARLDNGASRAQITEFLWYQVEERFVGVPNASQIDEIADEITERLATWSQDTAEIGDVEQFSQPVWQAVQSTDADPPAKAAWAIELPASQPAKLRHASLADLPHEHEGFREYEASADPAWVREETAQRQFRGQYFRRLRRLRERDRHSD